MKKILLVGAALAMTSILTPSQSQAQTDSSLSRDQQHTRESLGFSAFPTGKIARQIGSVPMTRDESDSFDRYAKIVREASEKIPEIDSNPDLLNAFVLPDVTEPLIRFTAGRDAVSDVKEWVTRTFPSMPTEVVEGPVSREARDQFWDQARAEVVYRRQAPTKEYPKTEKVEFPILAAFEKEGFYVEDARLGGEDWRVQLVVSSAVDRSPEMLGDPKNWGPRAEQVIRSLGSASVSGVDLVVVVPGSAPKKKQVAPGRPSGTDMARGGKEVRDPGDPNKGFCTTGPTVTSGSAAESILTAGHCVMPGTGTEANAYGNPWPVRIGSVQAQMTIACTDCVGAPPPPWPVFTVANAPRWFWGQGVDFAMLFYGSNPTQNGSGRHYFLEQNGSGQRFYRQQQGSSDIFNGQQLVCFEGASTSRGLKNAPANSTSWWYKTSCGTGAGRDATDYRTITLYWGDVNCGGDSGSLTHTSGWVNGLMVYGEGGIQAPIGPDNCETSGPISTPYGTTVVNATAGVSSFWKIHNYMIQYRGVTPWVLTW